MHQQLSSLDSSKSPPFERSFRTSDGAELFYRHWTPKESSDRAVLLLHRGHEHSGRLCDLANQLELTEAHIFAWDARGHGRSPGERGYAENFGRLVLDLDEFARHIHREHGIIPENTIVLGHSVAAVTVATWVHDYAPPIRAMVLATPAFHVKLYVPLAISGLRALQTFRGKSFIKSYVRAKLLTHDPEQAAAYDGDPLVSRAIATNILLDLHDTAKRIVEDAAAITIPTLALAAGTDWVVDNRATERFFQRLGSRDKQLHSYPGFGHAIFHEAGRELPITAVRRFIESQFRNPPEPVNLLDADERGFTKSEYDRLSSPLPPWNTRRLSFALQRAFLKTIPRLSEGIRLGWQTGFDSGRSLDHVYQNRASGLTPLGRMIDRIYLNAIGWRGIRIRKENLQRILAETIERAGIPGRPTHVVDIAAGPGRYVLEVLSRFPPGSVSAVLRDHNSQAREAGRQIAQQMGLQSVSFEDGDAFDFNALRELTPKPDIAIVSGLFELFPDNDKILRSLRGLAESMQDDGYLIYTNQPWHPQIEMIARVLVNREGKRWIMRRRTTAEMDQLVGAVGFAKVAMRIDPWGIFSVNLARKAVT